MNTKVLGDRQECFNLGVSGFSRGYSVNNGLLDAGFSGESRGG